MSGPQPFLIAGSDVGLENDKKSFLLPDKAFPTLENAYVWRDRVKKREGIELLGRLRRALEAESFANTTPAANTWSFNLFTELGLTLEPNAQIEPESLVITIAAPDTSTFTDNGDGSFAVTGLGLAAGSYVNYGSGDVVLNFTGVLIGGAAVTADVNYYPGLPVMGIIQREKPEVNIEETLVWDTIYCYRFNGTAYVEFIPGTTWNGENYEFFWGDNYRGSTASSRLLFVTNFNLDATGNGIRYTDGTTWSADFSPAVSSTENLYSCRIIISYYGRLLALDTFEGTARATAVQYYSRCRFSQIGNPLEADAWRSDIFGKGGFIDAPTSEEIISAQYYKNTLIVFFERSTWNLRYVGEYGVPFIWERISTDFGSESQFSTVLFDEGILAVGDRAIVSSNSQTVDRIDLKIPDIVFGFRNANQGPARVHGIRDFQKEIVYWCFNDSTDTGTAQIFPNSLLVYNYRNDTWATFRSNFTCFGIYQSINAVLWGDTNIFWGDYDVLWRDVDAQTEYPNIIGGNQQGYVHYLNRSSLDSESLSITGIDRSMPLLRFTIPSHNLIDGDIIYIEGLQFINTTTSASIATDLNDLTYRVTTLVPYDADIIEVTKWNVADQTYESDFSYTPANGTGTYIGGGQVTLLPRMNIVTKDFNPFMMKGKQAKLTFIDFLMDVTSQGVVAINVFADTTTEEKGNLIVGQQSVQSTPNPLFQISSNDIYWNRFYSTVFGQFISTQITYNDDQMNDLDIFNQEFVMNAMIFWMREGGRIAP